MFSPDGPKRLTLDGIDFYQHERGVLVGRIKERGSDERWRTLRDQAVKIGRWPILVGDGDVLEDADYPLRSAEILEKAATFDIDEWLVEKRESLQQELDEIDEELGEKRDRSFARAFPDQVDSVPPREVRFPYYPDPATVDPDEFIDEGNEVLVALLPTMYSWKAHAYIPDGGWNCYPFPDECVGILKSWHERFGAEVMAMSHDSLDLVVPSPVRDIDQACRLAEEQFFFCRDLQDLGHETVTYLAADLRRTATWGFWWD